MVATNPDEAEQDAQQPQNAVQTVQQPNEQLPLQQQRVQNKRRAQDAGPSDDGYNSGDEHGGRTTGQGQSLESVRDRELKFVEDLRTRGWDLRPVEGDGNCLFRSVAEQIYGDQSYHDVIRSSVFDYMEKNADYYSQYVTEDIHAYIARKRQDRVFGNQVEIQAITELYGRPVEVYAPEHSSNDPINTFQVATSSEVVPPIRLSRHLETHYNAVLDIQNPSVGVGLGVPGMGSAAAHHSGEVNAALAASEGEVIEASIMQAAAEQSTLDMGTGALGLQADTLEQQQLRDAQDESLKALGAAAAGDGEDAGANAMFLQQLQEAELRAAEEEEQVMKSSLDALAQSENDAMQKALADSRSGVAMFDDNIYSGEASTPAGSSAAGGSGGDVPAAALQAHLSFGFALEDCVHAYSLVGDSLEDIIAVCSMKS